MPDLQSAHIDWYLGHWKFDYSVSDSEGLSLLNGSYRGIPIIGKFSLPVIRVKYLVDGGWHDWRRPFGLGAGPYHDQIRWHLGGDHGLQRISGRGNNEYVLLNQSTIDGIRWLEIAVYARIGPYHIYQAWYLSEQGHVLPRIFSKGLTINMDHSHHPYWRLDFDIDGPEHNRVWVRDNGQWSFYPKEANDVKNSKTERVWYVQNQETKHGAWILPGKDDGVPDNFSRIDIGVRLYHESEESFPWPFGVGGLGFLDNESVDDSDVVFWYISHMFHRASEGGDAWHSTGPTIQVDTTNLPPLPEPPRGFGIYVERRNGQLGGELIVHGSKYTPGGQVRIVIENVPNKYGPIEKSTVADGNGNFLWSDTFYCTANHLEGPFPDVVVSAIDITTELVSSYSIAPTIWVC